MGISQKNIGKAFSLVELMVAVGLLAAVLAGSSVIFKVAIESQRQAGATAELMRNLRAVTEQLNTDFGGLEKGSFLVISSQAVNRQPRLDSAGMISVRRDNMIYFSAGQFQSLIDNSRVSNMAMIYLGLYDKALKDSSPYEPYCSKWILLRQAMLLMPETPAGIDSIKKSLAEYKADYNADKTVFMNDLLTQLVSGYPADPTDEAQNWQYFCGGVGSIKIEWTDGRKTIDNKIQWFGLGNKISTVDTAFATAISENEVGGIYTAYWTPDTDLKYWPKALKFTFTLYDSKGILKEGRTFTHIVYLGE